MAADARAICRNVSETRLELVPVGVGSALPAPGQAQSCYLVRAGATSVVMDLGSGTVSRLQTHIPPEDVDVLFITHMHPDHIVDLMTLRIYMMWGPGGGRRMRLIGPPGLRERLEVFTESDAWGQAFDFEEFAPGSGVIDLGDGLVVRHREVPHLPPTNALRLERGGASLCFGADCAPNTELSELAAGCDVLLAECTFGPSEPMPGVPHLTAREAGEIAAAAGVGRLLLTHCSPEHDPDRTVAAAREAYDGPIDWARPGEPVVL